MHVSTAMLGAIFTSLSWFCLLQGSQLLHVHAGTRSIIGQNDEGDSKINNISVRQDNQVNTVSGAPQAARCAFRRLCTVIKAASALDAIQPLGQWLAQHSRPLPSPCLH